MKPIAFIDTELDFKSKRVLDIGGIKDNGSRFRNASIYKFAQFLQGTSFLCGHNILNHDLKFIGDKLRTQNLRTDKVIDTLYLSPLLFPTKPYHRLVKDDKLQTDETNNPLNDAIKARDLFYDEVTAFNEIDDDLKHIYYLLLRDKIEFSSFFQFLSFTSHENDVERLIRKKFLGGLCENADLFKVINQNPVALAYCLAIIHSYIKSKGTSSITPPWVLKNYPQVEHIITQVRNTPCVYGCNYCNTALDIHEGLKKYFGYDSYRKFDGVSLQEQAVKAAIQNKSLLAVFPTGGGKSLTFQVPALIQGDASRALTIVISPLQSLMKDQVDNLEKIGVTDSVTINGLLDPIERAKAFERVANGSASILYISPESLRSRTIEKLILDRKVARFVIDEAHCFSAWGQDFRVDYLYIGDFIKKVQTLKQMEFGIPVSCFTATAKQKVIEDIRSYFKEKLSLDLELFTTKAARTNLQYKVFKKNEDEKYQKVRELIEEKNCPTIIYVSRTRRAYNIADQLKDDGFNARAFHGKMDAKEKTENQNAFISGEVQVMVATSAFGMGVDKKDVGMVIHYDISDSLENYVQEAGRAGRDENLLADCYVLYNESDLDKHFVLLNQTKLSIKEIQQVWKAIKDITKLRSKVSNSALEIARRAGWDDSVAEIETRVKTAIAALEDAGYIKRGQNIPRIFANSILCKNAEEAIQKIERSRLFNEKEKVTATRIIKKLFSSKSRKQIQDETAESRVDYISDHLGIVKKDVINIIYKLREENILADNKDLVAYINKSDDKKQSLRVFENFRNLENFLIEEISEKPEIYNIKNLNEAAEEAGCKYVNSNKVKIIFNYLAIKNWIKRKHSKYSKNHLKIKLEEPKALILEKLKSRHELAKFIIDYLFQKSRPASGVRGSTNNQILVEFSVLELKAAYERRQVLFKSQITADDIEDALFFLSRIEALKIEGGFLVVYNQMSIERLEEDNRKKYTKDDYKKLDEFYESRVHQIHIVGEYAEKMIADYKDALQFVEDYFQLNYSSFLRKYFKGSKADHLQNKMTPGKFRQLFGELSPAQLKIIKDNESKYIVVAAGPGSGKTRILVHKLASLLLMEDVKHEQLLMLTFSRAAASEFKMRLLGLVGNAANFVEIMTFHSFCFDILGRVGNLDKSDSIILDAAEKIRNNEVDLSRITKTVLVIDEAQDINEDEFSLIRALMEQNEEMRVIAVGDDDQNIFEFRGANSKYLERLISLKESAKYELSENYRSNKNLVEFTNQFVKTIRKRLKDVPIRAKQMDNGKLKLVSYSSQNLVTSLVEEVIETDLSGTTCVLTRTNYEASQIAGLLLRNGVNARLIQTNNAFNIYNLLEIRFFLDQLSIQNDEFVISNESWNRCKKLLKSRFEKSNKLENCLRLINSFEKLHPKIKYKSDFEIFVRESKLEDFINYTNDTIFVSTIHKVKGKEFDTIFLMLNDTDLTSDSEKRLLYVAMTRAKQNLYIHHNTSFPTNILADNLERINNDKDYLPPVEISDQLGHKDVWLGYFSNLHKTITGLNSGDPLILSENGLSNIQGAKVALFSKKYAQDLERLEEKMYQFKSARVNFIIYWKNPKTEEEVKIVLPEITFERV